MSDRTLRIRRCTLQTDTAAPRYSSSIHIEVCDPVVCVVQSTTSILPDFTTPRTDAYTYSSSEHDVRYKYTDPEIKMRIAIEMTLLMGSAALALASPVASPGPPKPPPKDNGMSVMVASVGRCPV